MSRLLILAFVVAAVAAPSAAPERRAPVLLGGRLTLPPVEVGRRCVVAPAPAARVVECSQSGTYGGSPARGRGSYAWHWHLELDASGDATRRGDEDGLLTLDFGRRGVLRLTTAGRLVDGVTRGTWSFRSGTKLFAKRRGSGTFRFEAVEAGPTLMTPVRLLVRGTLR